MPLQRASAAARRVVHAAPGATQHLGRRSFGGASRMRHQFRPSGTPPSREDASLPGKTAPDALAPTDERLALPMDAGSEHNTAQTPPVETPSVTSVPMPAVRDDVSGEPDDFAAAAADMENSADLDTQSLSSDAPAAATPRRDGPPSQLLINVAQQDEVRIALMRQGILEELYMERSSTELHVGNIYKGRVVNVEPSIQAAFIDFGIEKNGFLHISDLHPQYFSGSQRRIGQTHRLSEAAPDSEGSAEPADTEVEGADDEIPGGIYGDGELEVSEDALPEGAMDSGSEHIRPMEKVGRKTPRHSRPPIQQCLRRGQDVIVQVTKEGIGNKGPTLTSYISLPGRYLVMMAGMSQLGVSRKIENDEQRRAMRKLLQELNPPKNLGFIIRTAGMDRTKKELQQDLLYLVRIWKLINERIATLPAPAELYQESDLVIRTIRDLAVQDIDRIIVDDPVAADRVRDFLEIISPKSAGLVEVYRDPLPLFQRFNVERQIDRINARRVEMANGGSLVIDSAEALVAIDVNSGRYREHRDAELTAFNINKDAIREICRQLRLRDLGGVIVIDFIDMREDRHKREIERLLRDELRHDRARTKVLRMSQFCMIELTRQRMKPSLKRSIYQDCPHCHGAALIKTPESVTLDVIRRLAAGATRADIARIEVRVYPSVATFLLNRQRKALVNMEERTGKRFNITGDANLSGDAVLLEAFDARGNPLNLIL
ncbi:MAG: Rne/Rng family ribonuclease [Phycisphaerae bacterium]|nr:Rne/Rng family ribonuclease [Phycisphaerae bacterium]